MGCFDAVLFSAYRAGVIDRSWLERLHSEAANAAREAFATRGNAPVYDGYETVTAPVFHYTKVLARRMTSGSLTRYQIDPGTGIGGPDIPAGHIVFFDGAGGHTALSLGTRDAQGRQQVLSLWAMPAYRPAGRVHPSITYGVMQQTSVEALVNSGGGLRNAVIEFAAPSWAAPTAFQATGRQSWGASGSVAHSITDPVNPHVGMRQHAIGHIPVRSAPERVVAAARQLIGGLRWRGSYGPDPYAEWTTSELTSENQPNDMALWLHGKGPEPDERSTMNCSDAVLFAAYRAGVVDKAWLQRVHSDAASAASDAEQRYGTFDPDTETYHVPKTADAYGEVMPVADAHYFASIMASLHTGSVSRYRIDPGTGVGGPDVPAGHIVFFNGVYGHIALSVGTRDSHGNQEVLSMWTHPVSRPPGPGQPHRVGFMQETSIEELVTTGLHDAVIEFAAPPWANPEARANGHDGAASGSVAGSIIDPTAPHIGHRPPASTLASEQATARVMAPIMPAHRAGWVKERTAPRPSPMVGAGITVQMLTDKVATAVAEADRQLARAAKRFPWRPLPHGLQEVCLAQMRALADELFPLGIRSRASLDDAALPTDPVTRRWLERPQDWTWVTDWQALIDQVDGFGVNGAAFVVQGRPGAIGHAYAIINTTEGIHTADPQAGGVFPTSPAGLGPPFEVRALLIKPNGQATQPPDGTAQEARPHVDIDPDGIGWASSKRSALDDTGKVIPKEQRSCVEITVIPLRATDGPAWVQDAPLPIHC